MPSLRTLDRRFRPMAEAFFTFARSVYPRLVVTSARRTYTEQARLYSRHLQGKNNGLPAVPPGTSDHEFGLAFDMANPGVDPLIDPGLMGLGDAWQRAWGGRWNARDPVHFAAPLTLGRPVKRRRRRR